jgi:hypothetical protein
MIAKDKDKNFVSLHNDRYITERKHEAQNLRRRIFNLLNTCTDIDILKRISVILTEIKTK